MNELKPDNSQEENKFELNQEEQVIKGNDEPKDSKEIWQDIQVYSGKLFQGIGAFLHDITDIKEGLDEQGTRDSIQKNIQIKGSNIWLLMSAIMVASLGLNLNSPAVIIGAMLISPLMSPILGIGLSVGINDQSTLYQSLYHFGVAIIVSLTTSTLYFLLTPLSGEATNEMLARTSPTILDVLVAFFGGIAGIVSGSRLEKSNAIPGVAIATALLPPLCVSGYGLANGEWAIFFNSFYLFFLNCVFIAIATYIVVRFLGFRPKKYVDPKEQSRSTLYIVIFAFLIIAPSIFILSRVINEERVKIDAKQFVVKYFENDDRNIDWELKPLLNKGEETDSLLLKISVFGDTISQQNIEEYTRLLSEHRLRNIKLNVIQIHIPNIKELNHREQAVFSEEKESFQRILNDKNVELQLLKMQVDLLKNESALKELKGIELLEPQIDLLQYSSSVTAIDSAKQSIPTLVIKWKPNTSKGYKKTHKERVGEFVIQKMNIDTLQILEQ